MKGGGWAVGGSRGKKVEEVRGVGAGWRPRCGEGGGRVAGSRVERRPWRGRSQGLWGKEAGVQSGGSVRGVYRGGV